ncbi:phosphotransferase [Pontibacterium granulatum]|uniref:phosphotransferase n=1 Tax=Pontibacterium granulatum TaxID=2036029 RepID=UPI00249B41F5|nr:phosphotransferase [Pontibacterium granulatum]MDI3323527.1 phosphotransferase [Pontibacterium granulatum]
MPVSEFDSINQYLSDKYQLPIPKWQPFAGGSSNRLFSTRIEERSLVLRLNAPDSVAFGVDRAREAAILTLIGSNPWAPDVVWNDPHLGWLLMDWHGERLSAPLGESEQSQLLGSVTQWQVITSDDPVLQIDYQALFDGFRPQVKDLPMEQPLLTLIDGALRALDSLPQAAPVLVHHDLHPGNLCTDAGRLVVVDWEYGAIGNPWLDLAALNHHCGIRAEQLAMLPAVASLELEDVQRGLRRAVWLLRVLETLWYWIRGLKGTKISMKQLVTQTIELLKQ